MNILLINNNLYASGGDWSYIKSVADLYEQNGHTVYMWGLYRENNIYKNDEDLQVHPIDLHSAKQNKIRACLSVLSNSIYSKEAKYKIGCFLDRHKIDIVQLNSIRLGITPSIITTIKKRGIPIVWRMIDYYQICPNFRLRHHDKNCFQCVNGNFLHCILNNCKESYLTSTFVSMEAFFYKFKRTFNLVDAYSFQNNFSKDLFVKSGYELDKCYVHYNPYDSSNIKPSLGVGSSVLYFGRIEKEKGVYVLVETAKQLPDITFNIVGIGSEEEKIKHYVSQNNISNVHFWGAKWGKDVDLLIKKSFCVVVPSLWPEVSSYVGFQTYANGIPVIASNIGGLPEVVIENKTGFLFEAGNSNDLKEKIVKLYNDKNYASKLGINGRNMVEKLNSPERYYRDTIQLFEELINK